MTKNQTSAPAQGDNSAGREVIRVSVTYPPALKPYKAEVATTKTLGDIKAAALVAFGLTETAGKKFKLFHGGKEFVDMNETIGQVAAGKNEVVFQLEEFIVQG